MAPVEKLEVPPHLLHPSGGDHYLLRVVGDSMLDEGIFHGDFIVVQRRTEAAAGEMVVAAVAGDATVRRFYPDGEMVRLEAANPALSPIRMPAAEVRIQGEF